MDMTLADAGEELQALAQAGWTIHLWHEAQGAALGPLAARPACYVVEIEGPSGYPDGFEGEGATLAGARAAVARLEHALRSAQAGRAGS